MTKIPMLQIKKILNNKGMSVVEMIITLGIILILITVSTKTYLSFAEDAYLANDIAYINTMLVEIESLILSGDFNLPDNITTEVGKTTKTSVSNTGVIYVWSNGNCTSAYRQSNSSVVAKGEENLAKVLAICGKHTFESSTAISVGSSVNSSTSTPTMVAEIRYQVYKGIPYVYVWNYYQTSKDHWYINSYSSAYQLATEW
ncbi:MAG: hypothetical protein R3Y12_06560 [Clostridia bacterium]